MSSQPKRLLGVNIDHVVTLRQVRNARYPDLARAIGEVEAAGADFITAHLREDRRHIQDADVATIMATTTTWLNLEISVAPEMVALACAARPRSVCLVPERREELTTEGGIDVTALAEPVAAAAAELKQAGIEVSLFIEPALSQIDAAAKVGADAIELHTGAYALAAQEGAGTEQLQLLHAAAAHAHAMGLTVNCGHGLTVANVAPLVELPHVREYNIGHSIVTDALFCGLGAAVRQMREALAL